MLKEKAPSLLCEEIIVGQVNSYSKFNLNFSEIIKIHLKETQLIPLEIFIIITKNSILECSNKTKKTARNPSVSKVHLAGFEATSMILKPTKPVLLIGKNSGSTHGPFFTLSQPTTLKNQLTKKKISWKAGFKDSSTCTLAHIAEAISKKIMIKVLYFIFRPSEPRKPKITLFVGLQTTQLRQ